MSSDYIYLIRTREFIQLNQPVYKIGRTKQPNFNRLKQYPKGSEVIDWLSCFNCIITENILIKEFKQHFKHRPDLGNEYFEGNVIDMSNLLTNIRKNSFNNVIIDNNGNKYKIIEANDSMDDEDSMDD
jgi:hypothetical protein